MSSEVRFYEKDIKDLIKTKQHLFYDDDIISDVKDIAIFNEKVICQNTTLITDTCHSIDRLFITGTVCYLRSPIFVCNGTVLTINQKNNCVQHIFQEVR